VTLERDYEHLRRDAGLRRGTREVVVVQGRDAAPYLQGQCSQDLAGLEPGAAADTFLLSPEGRVEVLARVVRVDEDTFQLDTDAGFAEVLVARLRRFVLRSKLTIERSEWSCVSVRGPSARDWPGLTAPVVVPVDWPGWVGVDLFGAPADLVVPEELASCGEAAWEAARIEAGVPAMGREVGNGEIPAETGLVRRTVSFTKGCFTGQELVARMDARGSAPPHRLAGLVLEVDVDPGELRGAELVPEGTARPLGRVTSAASCPGLGAVGALAYVHRSVPVPGRVQVVSRHHPHRPAPLGEVRPLPMV
jgi:folate-binding protein YgfZ